MLRVAPIAVLGVLAIGASATRAGTAMLDNDDRTLLLGYARDTWRSIEALTSHGPLPVDALWREGDSWSPAYYTSPTNIAAYLWSTIAAEGLGLIDSQEAGRRLGDSLAAIGRLERSHGFFYNWYDARTGERVRVWPGGGSIRPFLSTVDNGWLAAALMMVGQARPELKPQSDLLLAPMNFGFFYDPHDPADPENHPGLLRGGYWTQGGGEYAGFHYGVLNTEPRIASYIGIARGDLPADHYYRMARAEADPAAPVRTYAGVPVVESSRRYRGARLLPSWDGTMFEALMVPLFVPEASWSPGSWGENHRLYAEAQVDYGLNDAKLGTWGISASADGRNGYHAFGVAALGLSETAGKAPRGMSSKVVTPHASFLALPYVPKAAIANLRTLCGTYPIYGPYGFFDAVDVGSGQVSETVLVLDQGMILASIANALGDDLLQHAFAAGAVEAAIRPLLAVEQFEVGDLAVASRSRSANSVPARRSTTRPDPAAVASKPRRTSRDVPTLKPTADDANPLLLFSSEDRPLAIVSAAKPNRRRGGRPDEKRRATG